VPEGAQLFMALATKAEAREDLEEFLTG